MRSENPIRAAKISYIVTSVAFCVLGILLIVLRNWSVSFIGVVTGIMLIAFGIVKLLGYFSKDLYRLAFQFDLAFGVLLIALGVVVLRSPDRALSFLCLTLGIAIMADGLFKLQSAMDARRFGLSQWGLLLGLAICAGVIGAALTLRPTDSARVMMILLGVGMLFEGVLNLCMALFAIKIVKHQQPEVKEFWIHTEERQE
mgnify:CR=1 FL=1